MRNRDETSPLGRNGRQSGIRSLKPYLKRSVRLGVFCLPFAFGLVLPHIAAGEEQGRRVALVIGNQDYQHVEPLVNPVNDTKEITRILRNADFDVTIGTDLTKKGLEKTVRRFLRELKEGDTALFYYSGHALQVGDANFILPVDAKLSSQYDLEFESIKVSHLLDYMKAASSLQIVMLDACRDNPFEISNLFWGEEKHALGKTRGLRRIPNKLGAFISYATRPGQVAYDGEGPMSPFTSSVVNNALDPALEIKDLMTRVREEVVRKTGGLQIPYEDSTLVTNFYFVPPKPAPIVTAHHRVSIPDDGSATALEIPEPVQPEGGELTATLTLLPEKGELRLPDGQPIAEGKTLAAAELTGLQYVPAENSSGDVELIGYQVKDQWGGTASAIASITVVQAAEPVAEAKAEVEAEAKPEPEPEGDGSELLSALVAWMSEKAASGVFEADIGVGPVAIYPDAPVKNLPAANDWATVISVDADLQLSSDGRLLQAGDRFPVSDLNALTVRPQIGSEQKSSQFVLELPSVAETPATTITQDVQPRVTKCDQLATQPFDLQAVTEGRLANALDPREVELACTEAMAAYPDIGRFVFQRGRGSFAAGDLESAISDFEQAYQKGHVRAGQVLGRMYYLGAGIDRDRKKAVDLYRKAAERGDAYALHSLGMAELKGEGTAQNEETGLEKLLQSVEAGHTFSFNAIGGFYLNGEHVTEDTDRAVYYYNRSASRDDIYGYLNMGTLYRDGKGVPQNFRAALGWFKKAHEGGHPSAGTAIGLLYFNGQGVDKSSEEATKWFRASAERGDPWGAFNTAFMLSKQSGEAADLDRVRMLAMSVAVEPSSQAAEKARAQLKKAGKSSKAKVLQKALTDLGFNPGPVDGKPGRKTREAIAEFFEASERKAVQGDEVLISLIKHQWEQARPRYDLF